LIGRALARRGRPRVSISRLQCIIATANRIQLCGACSIILDGRERNASLRGGQARALLGFLVLERRRAVARSELNEILWGPAPPMAPDQALRALLSNLRRSIGPQRLLGRDAVRVHLPPDTWIDVEAAASAVHDAESAVALGEWNRAWIAAHIAMSVTARQLLPFLSSPWIDERRRWLDALRVRAFEALAASALALGGPETATAKRAALALIDAEPLRESGYRLLMETHEAEGNPAQGLVVFEELRTLLRDQLGTAPTEASRAIHRRLLGEP
jgi:SARP family transcriptional regulator, regulator of embCAB operon